MGSSDGPIPTRLIGLVKTKVDGLGCVKMDALLDQTVVFNINWVVQTVKEDVPYCP